jgi:hypothetical protein
MDKLNTLFQEIKALNIKYDELKSSKAYDFNIFTLLHKASDEVNLHSKFIYELLNPKGTHSQGRLFLDLFLKEIFLNIPNDRVEAFREKYNIDILLQSSMDAIIIETKPLCTKSP